MSIVRPKRKVASTLALVNVDHGVLRLYGLLVRRVAKLVVCNPRKNALLKSGSKSDAIDARKLSELLRVGMLSPVYHGEQSGLEVQHLVRSYQMLTEDTTRVMGWLKAVLRGLNWIHNHELKNLFKAVTTMASVCQGGFREFYLGLL